MLKASNCRDLLTHYGIYALIDKRRILAFILIFNRQVIIGRSFLAALHFGVARFFELKVFA